MDFKNQVIISGKAYRPQLRTTKSGKSITTFGLSVWSGKDADGKSQYNFIDCKCFSDESGLAGDVVVTGKLSFENWTKEGKKFSKPVIIVDRLDKGDEPPFA